MEGDEPRKLSSRVLFRGILVALAVRRVGLGAFPNKKMVLRLRRCCGLNNYSPLEGQARLKNEGLSARQGRRPAVAPVGGEFRLRKEEFFQANSEECEQTFSSCIGRNNRSLLGRVGPPTASAFAQGLSFCDSPSRGE